MTWARNLTEQRERRAADKERNLAALLMPPRTLHKASYGPAQTAAAPKPQTPRNQAVLDMAQERPCQFQVPGECTDDRATTVACHENQGKGMGIKASDARVVYGCMACHRWYDTGTAPRDVKRTRFQLGLLNQCVLYRQIAGDPSEPVRFRRAAEWALEHLNAHPDA